jgi:nitroimidazol reductase NimA-like FMN-containing flavoprotein (pyridoxamine 5'-phosphate oxidase superfamily)
MGVVLSGEKGRRLQDSAGPGRRFPRPGSAAKLLRRPPGNPAGAGNEGGPMSTPPKVRRTDRILAEDAARATLADGFCGRLATVGADGYPYCVPLLYVWMDGEVWLHNTRARGHLRTNVDHDSRVCFEVDEPGEVFAYGRFECDSSVAYRSVILFGRIRVVEDRSAKQRFCDALMAKYAKADWDRPKGFFPRLDDITVYAIAVERLTGKTAALPAVDQQWPATDGTKSPNAKPPGA